MTMNNRLLPTYDDVVAASKRLERVIHHTPILRSRTLNDRLGAEVFFKCENLQRTGAFKLRGAYNALSLFTPEQKRHGVLAYSTGNHSQAVALAAQILDMPALILMPEDAQAAKLAATRAYGAQVLTYNRFTEDREAISHRLAQERGMTVIPPFNHRDVIAGQGTAAMELLEQVPNLDYLFVCLGGGGLLAGSLLVAKQQTPDCKVYGAEPEAGNDAQQSLRAGRIITIPAPRTLADGAQTQALGELPFALIREHVQGILTATDEQLVEAMRFYAERMKIVVEPTGALSLAVAMHGGLDLSGSRVGILITGGNIDMARYARLLGE
ncbi:threo-3-hydroxy-L-aspartate ammonia-lyase [Comamonas composti]|uniref:threo-3-hydroxy-L-aspartate ammonia-lyase n=1 Tax=Comamonas composti TaxID=408558 RepID=UPI0004141601|nr:threo-3-hydroxy-L-aspartate ammonia-lyase [Comamonas composti]